MKQKTYLVSGSTSGIGLAVVEKLKAQGDRVLAFCREGDINSGKHLNEFIIGDFEYPEEVKKNVELFTQPIDGFINCAGIAIGKPVWDNRVDEIKRLVNVNLITPMVICGALKKNLRPGGAIILLSSKSACGGGWDDAYIASKGGINALVKSLALKFAPEIRVIGVAPGVTANTRMTRERKQDDLKAVVEKIPLGELALPRQIAAVIVGMLGEAGEHITGALIDVNGGAYLR